TLVLAPVASGKGTFFRHGLSRVVNRAAIAPAGDDPTAVVRAGAGGGAAAVILHGRPVAPGSIALDRTLGVPVITLPEAIAQALLSKPQAVVVIAAPRPSGAAQSQAAPFSSWGLAFDGRGKPDLLA